MPWTGTPAEKRAYAMKKRAERLSLRGDRPLPGYEVAPDDHRCDVGTIVAHRHAGTPIVGRRCTVCGREWRYVARGEFVNIEVFPVTRKCAPFDEPAFKPRLIVDEPTGQKGELPPDVLVGYERGEWWGRWALRRQERRQAARQKLAS